MSRQSRTKLVPPQEYQALKTLEECTRAKRRAGVAGIRHGDSMPTM
jgi:hypothetical protein